jgi:hypothetical protein
MKVQELASLRKRTKSGISVWRFFHDGEAQRFYAVGGEVLKVIEANDQHHLRQIFTSFQRYGYTEKLAPKKPWISDPWASELPSDIQQKLELLSA